MFAATAGAGAAEDEDEGGGNDDANGRRHKMRKDGKDREDRQNTFGYGTCPQGTPPRGSNMDRPLARPCNLGMSLGEV